MWLGPLCRRRTAHSRREETSDGIEPAGMSVLGATPMLDESLRCCATGGHRIVFEDTRSAPVARKQHDRYNIVHGKPIE